MKELRLRGQDHLAAKHRCGCYQASIVQARIAQRGPPKRMREPRTEPVKSLHVGHRERTSAARSRKVHPGDRLARIGKHGIENTAGVKRRLNIPIPAGI